MFFPIDSFQITIKSSDGGCAPTDLCCVSTVGALLLDVAPVYTHTGCLQVLDFFIENEDLLAISVVDFQHRPVGIVDRVMISEIFLKPFSRELLHKKPITEIMDDSPIIVDIETAVDEVAQLMIESGMRTMINGFILTKDGCYAGMATGHALLEQITYHRQCELYSLAHYDQLTGLPNRLLFNDRLEQACSIALQANTLMALVFVDLDRFKYINDTMGHSFGDALLVGAAERLSAGVRDSDTVARLGGDEFVIILQNIVNPADVDTILNKITELLRKPMTIAGRDIQITASMGVALYPLHDDTVDGLICKADAAMYEVKQRGRNDSMVFSVEINQDNIARMSMETQLRMALDAGELCLYYQPQVMIPDYQVVGVEALMRWQHPELGMVSPAEFIPIAEETGLIIAMGDWLLREACSQQLRWLNMGLPAIRVAVNISAVQFQEPHFCERVKHIIEFTGIDPQYLELELTESVVMKSAEHAIQALTELRALGVKLAIDDFGTGYSSLSYLRKFPIDRIKIDKSFVRNIKDTPVNEAIVRAIIALGQSLGLSTIAEGVENNDELECVARYNCCEVQGYRFAKPMPSADFVEWFFSFMKSAITERKNLSLARAD